MAMTADSYQDGLKYKSAHVHRTDFVQVSNYCPERPYVELQVPKNICPIYRVVFRTVSHDQGFSNEQETYRGLYEDSFSWFEASVVTPSGRDRIPRRHLQSNAHAVSEFREHEICWDLDNCEDALQRWLCSIQPGDIIQIIPKARHLAWRNIIKEAEITAFGTGSENASQAQQVLEPGISVYRSLSTPKETRLIIIWPGTGDSDLVCSLQNTIIGDRSAKPYECLSYCWGDRKDAKFITVSCSSGDNSPSFESLKAVTSNLHDALLGLRHPSQPRTMWIDALSINQDDQQELSGQVAIMREIYSQAEKVIVWFGRRTKIMDDCIDTAEQIQQRYKEYSGDFKSDEVMHQLHASILDGFESYHIENPLFHNEFFRRAWVLQEVFNGKEVSVLYRGEIRPWSMILRLNECITRSTRYANPVPKNAMAPLFARLFTPRLEERSNDSPAFSMGYSKRPENLKILDVVLEGLDLEATDPRDKIFALLSFGEETSDFTSQPAEIQPDYTKNVARVFADFTRWWITTYKSLEILSAIHMSRGRTWMRISSLDLPEAADRATWSLWHDGKSIWSQGTLGLKPDSPYHAAGERVPEILTLTDPMLLSLNGRLVGVIETIRPFPYYPLYSQHIANSHSRAPSNIQDIYNAYVHIFDPLASRGTWTSTVQRDDVRQFRTSYDEKETMEKNNDHFFTHAVFNAEQPVGQVSEQSSCVACHDSCFFRTSQGTPGLCPATARAADIIVVLYGGRVPYVIRAQPTRGTGAGPRYALIGECYLDGHMYGRAVEEQSISHQKAYIEQTFTLI